MISLNYGDLPDRNEFVKHTKEHFPYPMELVGEDAEHVTKAVNQGIDAYLEAVQFEQFQAGHKLGVGIKDPESMHTLLRRLIEMGMDIEELDNDEEGPLDLASCILGTLDYEWV